MLCKVLLQVHIYYVIISFLKLFRKRMWIQMQVYGIINHAIDQL